MKCTLIRGQRAGLLEEERLTTDMGSQVALGGPQILDQKCSDFKGEYSMSKLKVYTLKGKYTLTY